MTNDQIQSKRDALELNAQLLDPKTNELIMRLFHRQLVDHIEKLLNPEMGDADVLATRLKAVGIIEALMTMGHDLKTVHEPVSRVVNRFVKQNVQPWA